MNNKSKKLSNRKSKASCLIRDLTLLKRRLLEQRLETLNKELVNLKEVNHTICSSNKKKKPNGIMFVIQEFVKRSLEII